MIQASRTFAGHLKHFSRAVDIVDKDTFDRVRDLIIRYVRRELGEDAYFVLLREQRIGQELVLQTLWSSEDKVQQLRILAQDAPATISFLQAKPLWVISGDHTPLDRSDSYHDQWSGLADLPPHTSPTGRSMSTLIVVPLRRKRVLGVLCIEARNYIEATDVARKEMELLGDALAILLELWELNESQSQQTEEAFDDLRDMITNAKFPRLAKPQIFVAHSSLLRELEAAHHQMFSLAEIARDYLRAAGFELDPAPDQTLFLCDPKDSVWQQHFSTPIPTRVLSGIALDRQGVQALFADATTLLGAKPRSMFVICDQPPADGAWLQIGALRAEDVQIMPIDDTILLAGQQKGDQRGELRIYLEERFLGPRRDLYDRQNPISDRLNFFGREKLANRLTEDLARGNAVALLGLRKMGKSSLLNYLRDKLPCPVALVDLQAGIELSGVYQRILNDWSRSMRVKVPDLAWPPPRIAKTGTVSDTFAAATRGLLDRLEGRGPAGRLVLLVDEIESMAPTAQQQLKRFRAFARALRGLAQERVGGFGLIIAGVDPSIVRTSRFAGQQNPFYNFFREQYLPPLNREDCIQMIRNIGVQMGLHYTDEAVTFIAAVTGGHPYWARKLCSVAFKSLGGSTEITLDLLRKVARRFILEPPTARLLDNSGLWGEITDPHLWPKRQISANEEILLSLAKTERQRTEELIRQGVPRSTYTDSLYELKHRSVLGEAMEDTYWIHLQLFRNWIRSDKLGEQ